MHYRETCDTPSLIVDIDKMESNIRRMAEFVKSCGVRLRPHVKSHKVPEIAKIQLQNGAKGVCVQKLGEAEVFSQNGIDDIFITNEIVGVQKLERLSRLAQKSHLGVAVDCSKNIADLATACKETGAELDVYIDVDVGMKRCGVPPDRAGEIAILVTKHDNLRLKGIMGYEGHIGRGLTTEERLKLCQEAMDSVVIAKKEIERQGIEVEEVSVGSSVTTWTNAKHPVVTEVQPGMYIFNGGNLVDAGVASIKDCALTVLTTVMSKQSENRAVVDAGSKAFQWDLGKYPWFAGNGKEVALVRFSEEHGWLSLNAKSVDVGDKVEFIPYHCCTSVNQYDELIGVRNSKVERIWPILARGKMT